MSERTVKGWRATSAWSGIARIGTGGAIEESAGVRLELLDGVGLATIIVRDGREAELARIVDEHLGCKLPPMGKASFGGNADLIWSAPGQWLVASTAATVLVDLPARLAGIAAMTDQSDSRALVKVGGAPAREALQKGFAIDLHPSVFDVGSTAVTNVAHISVQIWQLDATPRYTIAVPRSFSRSFWSWLIEASAAYGYEVRDAA